LSLHIRLQVNFLIDIVYVLLMETLPVTLLKEFPVKIVAITRAKSSKDFCQLTTIWLIATTRGGSFVELEGVFGVVELTGLL
jgi:hypothetical protein